MTYRKGEKGENEVCQWLEGIDKVRAKRNLAERRSGERGDLITNLPCEFEVKAQKSPSVYTALEEVWGHQEQSGEDYAVAVVKRKNGRGKQADRFVAMSWNDFESLVTELIESGCWEVDDVQQD